MQFFNFVVPSAPRNFMLSTRSSRTLSASWAEPDPRNGIISNYTIRCNETEFGSAITPLTIEGNSVFTATLMGLTPFTEYECTISASTGAGEGNQSDPQTATTDEDGKLPQDLRLSIINGTYLPIQYPQSQGTLWQHL